MPCTFIVNVTDAFSGVVEFLGYLKILIPVICTVTAFVPLDDKIDGVLQSVISISSVEFDELANAVIT